MQIRHAELGREAEVAATGDHVDQRQHVGVADAGQGFRFPHDVVWHPLFRLSEGASQKRVEASSD